jgi:putative transposase
MAACGMRSLLSAALGAVRSSFQSRASLTLENFALRQQLAALKIEHPRPHLGLADRLFWVALSRWWSGWKDALAIVTPATVVGWHREGYRLFWRWKSRRRPGRPPTEESLRALIRRLERENPTWGAPRVHAELLKLGYHLAESTVAKYLDRPQTPSPTWKTFLDLHLKEAAGMDFFTIPTVSFGHLYGLVIIGHDDVPVR